MNKLQFKLHSLNDIPDLARKLIPLFNEFSVWGFYGEMGAGKTTIIREICGQLGVSDNVTSPTFALVNEYRRPGNNSIYHFDFYRIKDIREAYDLGYEEYFFGGNLCFIEWPEMVTELLPMNMARIKIIRESDNSRTVNLELPAN